MEPTQGYAFVYAENTPLLIRLRRIWIGMTVVWALMGPLSSLAEFHAETNMFEVGGAGFDVLHAITHTSDGGYVATGMTDSQGEGSKDIWLMKFTAQGVQEWETTFGNAGYERAVALGMTPDNGYVLVGGSSSQAIVIRVDKTGNLLWERHFGGEHARTEAVDIVIARTGESVIVGYTQPSPESPSSAWMIKLDTHGQALWERTFSVDYAQAISALPEEGYIVAGTDTNREGRQKSVAWVAKLDHEGSPEWQYTFGSQKEHGAEAVQVAHNGDIWVGGYAIPGGLAMFGGQRGGAWVFKLNQDGRLLWEFLFNQNTHDKATDMLLTPDAGCLVVGTTFRDNSAVNGHPLVLKLSQEGKTEWTWIGEQERFFGRSLDQLTNGHYVAIGGGANESGDVNAWLLHFTDR